jgi:hypothetical protein
MPDELDRLSSELFDAARRDAPSPALRARLLELPSEKRRFNAPVALGVGALLALAAAVAVMIRASHGNDVSVEIDREPSTASAARERPRPNAEAIAPSPAPTTEPSALAAKRRSTAKAPSASAGPPTTLTLSAELALLNEARAHVSQGEPARALELLARHDRAPNASLRAEAALLRIEALRAAGDVAQAAELAKEFVERYPQSPLADRARRLSTDGEGSKEGGGSQ